MENTTTLKAQPIEQCAACYKTVAIDDVYCPDCGYPLKGTETEQMNFMTTRDFRDIDLADFHKKVKKAGNVLYYLSGIFVLSGAVSFFLLKNDANVLAIVISYLILAILFLVLGAYSAKKPLLCIISGLCLYAVVLALSAIDDPMNIVRGIVFKIIIIGFMIKGIKSAIEIEKIKKEHNIS